MKQNANETLSDIRRLMESSQKVMYIDGGAGVLVSLWAGIGSVVASYVISGSVLPAFFLRTISASELVSGPKQWLVLVALLTFSVSFVTLWLKTRRRAVRMGYEFTLEGPVRRLLLNFFAVMITGGLVCLSTFFNDALMLVPGFMLVFYGIALIVISPVAFKYSITQYLGFAQILLGIAALCVPQFGLSFWFVGFCLLHLLWGLWFRFSFDGK